MSSDSTPSGWTPEPPDTAPSYPGQRYFRSDPIGQVISSKYQYSYDGATVRVMRTAPKAFAKVSLRFGPHGAMDVHLSADELRTLAYACLDAALDIENDPAGVR